MHDLQHTTVNEIQKDGAMLCKLIHLLHEMVDLTSEYRTTVRSHGNGAGRTG